MAGFAELRARMVERQLRRRGIDDERVLAAMGEVPREEFVPAGSRGRAYSDAALPIDEGQTISQPWIVAAICQALELRGDERVLEVGSGSGYSAALLARLAVEVIAVERHESLAVAARGVLGRLGYANVELLVGDGSRGLPERAPFDAIAVHATAPVPPRTLLGQLADGGRLVVPLAGERVDLLTLFRRRGGELRREEIGPCRFVPLIGEEGFAPD
ncbi:MAG TPA: protein-L-isoaspartate(D-aspartate) O-methyltransferase [Solirubrobacterales bacterium]|nr:protein-L-isoaspartate(D-aspartate) O-methyltransferase [Solirubrobacterales bacterium]